LIIDKIMRLLRHVASRNRQHYQIGSEPGCGVGLS
jgi:hypothetical protein